MWAVETESPEADQFILIYVDTEEEADAIIDDIKVGNFEHVYAEKHRVDVLDRPTAYTWDVRIMRDGPVAYMVDNKPTATRILRSEPDKGLFRGYIPAPTAQIAIAIAQNLMNGKEPYQG